MRRWHKVAIALLAVVGALGAAAFCELVLDLRTPRSALQSGQSVNFSSTYVLADVKTRSLELQKIYGATASTSIGPGGILTTKVDGTVVHREHMPGRFADAWGLFLVGTRDIRAAVFPFELGPEKDPKDSRHTLTASLKASLRNSPRAQDYLNFTDSDWDLGQCGKPDAAALGWGRLGAWLGLQQGAACVIAWKGRRPASMLVSLSIVDGSSWLRPFLRRLCRATAAAALDLLVAAESVPPDYAACILVHERDQTEAGRDHVVHIYEVGHGRRFALIGK